MTASPSVGVNIADDSNALAPATQKVVEFREAHPDLDEKMQALETGLPAFDADVEGDFAAAQRARENTLPAREQHNRARDKHSRVDAEGNLHVDADHPDVVQAEKAYELAKEVQRQAQQRATKTVADRAGELAVVAGARKLLNAMAVQGVTPEFVTPPKPRTGHVLDVITAIEADRVAALAEVKATEHAPRPADDDIADAFAELDKVEAGWKPGVSLRRDRVRLAWPVAAVNAAPGDHDGGSVPHITDPMPLLVHIARAELEQHIRAEISIRRAADATPQLSDLERADKLAELHARLDLLEREEAAAVWAARAKGHRVAWRQGISIKAVLGLK